MTLGDLGNIGEFVGALGVVASLVYVAIQIRQNTQQISENTNSVLGSAELENARISSEWLLTIARDPELARVWHLGLSEPAKLTEEQGIQFTFLMGSSFYELQAAFRQYKRGLLPEDSWVPFAEVISRYMSSPAALTWWSHRDVPFAQSFSEYVDSRIASSRVDEAEPGIDSIWRGPDA